MPARRTSAIYLSAVLALCVPSVLGAAAQSSPVADAAMRGETEVVRSLLQQGADVNAAQGDGMTALHWAARRGDPDLAEMLLYAGANPDATTRIGDYTPLHMASQAGAVAVVEALLKAGGDANTATTAGGAMPLHFAAGTGSSGAVSALLDNGAEVNAREGAREQTPLMWAASYNRVEAIRLLVQAGADVGMTTEVIDIAARDAEDNADRQSRDQRLAALRSASAEVGGEQPPLAERRDQQGAPRIGNEPPPGQQRSGQQQGAGRRPNQPPGARPGGQQQRYVNEEEPLSYADLVGTHGGMTALLHAAREGRVEAAMELLDAGADIDQVSGDHTSPMLIAMINGHFDLALLLLERGADPTIASDAGNTPLYAVVNTHWAPKSRYPRQSAFEQQQATYLEVMEQLLDAGADSNAQLTKHLWYVSFNFDLLRVDTKGATPFWRAAYALDVEGMHLLAARGADPNIPTQKPAARFRRGRDPEGGDPSGLLPVPVDGPAVYPIHAASGVGYGQGFAANAHRHAPNGWLPTVKYLVEELGADVNARDLNGYSALHHAAARGDNELIRYLVEQGADVTVVSRRGQTTVDMANGPVQRIQPFPETIELLESLGAKNNHNCVSC